jgi:excinuclease ABC subunit B
MSERDIAKEIKRLEKQMLEFARNLEFEAAASTRDQLSRLRALTFGASPYDQL